MLIKYGVLWYCFGVIYGIITGKSEAVTNAVIGGGNS